MMVNVKRSMSLCQIHIVFCVSLGMIFCANVNAMKEEQEPMVLANPWGGQEYDPTAGREACESLKKFLPIVSEVMRELEREQSSGREIGNVVERETKRWVANCTKRAKLELDYTAALGKSNGSRCALEGQLRTGDVMLLRDHRRLATSWSQFVLNRYALVDTGRMADHLKTLAKTSAETADNIENLRGTLGRKKMC